VIGREDPITGQAIFAFVSLRGGDEGSEELSKELREHVVKAIGRSPVQNDHVYPGITETRSGKIMRRLLRDMLNGSPGDTTTLADSTVVESIRSASEPARLTESGRGGEWEWRAEQRRVF